MISSYKELPIGKYRKIMDLCRDESLSHFNMQMAVFSVLSDMSEDVLLDMPITEFQKIALAATFLEKIFRNRMGIRLRLYIASAFGN